ncbi:C4-type zinc ribbon domain-containing protein [Bacteroidales bacterium]|nr:C4-type zinc ribbon domain-containing protein [Bacteroidales bacterium]
MADKATGTDISVEEKLKALHKLQVVHSKIDKIKILRGELPLEVQDLEDEIAGLETRLAKYEEDIAALQKDVSKKKEAIQNSNALIAKYKDQQNNVRNNREYDSLTKEIEFQNLEIELSEKRIKEFSVSVDEKKKHIDLSKANLSGRKEDLTNKKGDLNEITSETEKEEDKLNLMAEDIEHLIEDRILSAYTRIRSNARNGLAIVTIERNACGGCFNKIPPQRQLDIASRKKIIVCEYCGRILVDNEINLEEIDD